MQISEAERQARIEFEEYLMNRKRNQPLPRSLFEKLGKANLDTSVEHILDAIK